MKRRQRLFSPLVFMWLAFGAATLSATQTAPKERSMATVVVDVFSGRPNPEWALTPDQEIELQRRLAAASPARTPLRPPPGLGYRGIVVRLADPKRELRVYAGHIESPGSIGDDPGRGLERWLLETGRATLDQSLAEAIAREIGGP